MAYISKHNLHTKYPPASGCMRSIWDAVLQKIATKYHNTDLSVPLWWEGYKHVGRLLIPEADMDICCNLKPGESWETVEEHLYAVINSCDAGHDVFSNQITRLHRLKSTKAISDVIQKLCLTNVTEATVTLAKTEFANEMRSMNVDPHKVVSNYKHTTCQYRNVQLTFTINSAMEQFRTELGCFLQCLGVETQVLPAVGCENELVGRRPPRTITVEKDCVADSKRARNTANDLLRGVEQSSGPAILQLFKEHSAIFRGLDKMWKVVFTLFFSCVGEPGDARLKDLVRAALPSATQDVGASQSLQTLDNISHGMLLQFCGAGAGAIFAKIHASVRAIAHSRVPDLGADTSSFGNEIRLLVANFMKYEYPVGHAKVGEKLFGTAAAHAYYQDVEVLVTANSPEVCMTLLTPLQVYGWLLKEDQQKQFKVWTNKEFQKGAVPADGACVVTKSKGGRKRLAPDSSAEVAKMFKN
jgi:hypothetical protein